MNDQPSLLGRNNHGRSPSPRRKKARQKYAPKACVSCRRSKLKCSGDNPCQRCRDNSKRCFYSEDQTAAEALQNLSRPALSHGQPPPAAVSVSNGSGLARRSIVPRRQTTDRRASDASTQGLSIEARMTRIEAMMEALLQDRAMAATPSASMEHEASTNDLSMSMSLLDPVHSALALLDQPYGNAPSQDNSAPAIDPSLTPDTASLRVGNRTVAFPVTAVYQAYIDTFFQGLQAFHPCIDEHVFRTLSNRMLAAGEAHADQMCLLALNYVIFAWQDISTGIQPPTSSGGRPGCHWLQLADEVVGTRQLHGQGDQSLAQFLLFKALYYCLADQPSLAYSTIGLASRYVFHHGLNRQPTGTPPDLMDMFTRSRTFWSILVADRRISLSCGRPYSVRDLDVDVQQPSHIFEQHVTDSGHLEISVAKMRAENAFLECMIHWSRFASSLWDSVFAVKTSSQIHSEKVATFDSAVANFFQETYPLIPIDLSQAQHIQYTRLSFNNLRLLARRRSLLTLRFSSYEASQAEELIDETLACIRIEAIPEPSSHTLQHHTVPSLTSILLILCSLIVSGFDQHEVGVDFPALHYMANFDTTLALLRNLADYVPLAQRVLVDMAKVIGLVQQTNATWADSGDWNVVKSGIPSNVADLFPYTDPVPILQTTQITHSRRPSGITLGASLEDRANSWVIELSPEEVGRGVLWI